MGAAAADVSALADRLRQAIAREGPITVARYMAEALGHPAHGYYTSADPLGAAGDFTTAPEISQMFGELIGLWCLDRWRAMGAPRPVIFTELGPGRGTLMADALRAARLDPGFLAAAEIHLVETSPALGEKQAAALEEHRVTWHTAFSSVPAGPLLLVANEFLDALPIHQFERTREGWHERLVTVDAATGAFAFTLSPTGAGDTVGAGSTTPPKTPVGAILETRPTAIALAQEIGVHLLTAGGAALLLDYGHARSAPGDTLQAVRRHAPHPVLEDPGSADLTAHVDFEALARAAGRAGAVAHGPVTQGAFLTALGIEARAAALLASATPAQATHIETARRRLTAPDAMGTLFKVMALTPPGMPAPAGFDPGRARS
jgi:NADH dehydrogenase [ubiquinone] 1 alpha subcomplex assembly factor 7